MKKLIPLLSWILFFHCDSDSPKQNFNGNTFNNLNNSNCVQGSMRCHGSLVQVCRDRAWNNEITCGIGEFADLPTCNPDTFSCVQCLPNGTTCGPDNHVHVCTAGGERGLVQDECNSAQGEQCVEINGIAACDSPCLRAAANNSYRGCEYYSVGMSNSYLDSAFHNNFAIAVDNNNDAAVRVTIQGGSVDVDEMIPARTLHVFRLRYVEAVRNPKSGSTLQSGIFRTNQGQGAFHVLTSLPVTVYQFNPYDFAIGNTNSYTNDASLLLPVTVLSRNYLVMSRPTWLQEAAGTPGGPNKPGTVTIVATTDNTSVLVQTRAHVAGGIDVNAMTPGGQGNYLLNRGDILQLVTQNNLSYGNCPSGPGSEKTSIGGFNFCNPGHAYDLTGTMVTSTEPVAVWGGHDCTFIPYNTKACDHIEEMIFPLETWGKRFLVGLTRQVEPGSTESNIIRILASENNANITFNPPSVHGNIVLNMGEHYEFMPAPNSHFEILSNVPILVGKFTVGQNYWTNSQSTMGDPAFGLVVPVEQYRSEYNFTAPPSMTANFVNVITRIPTDSSEYILLNDVALTASDYIPIGTTGYGVAQMDITHSGSGGSHRIVAPSASTRFGIEVYGFARFTSYLYPGGLDLQYINPIGK